jgi:hypothetical protein
LQHSVSILGVKKITAYTSYGLGAPLVIKILGDDDSTTMVSIFTDDEALSQRLADAINGAVTAPDPLPDAAHHVAHSPERCARIEQLEAALFPAKNALNAVRILMKNQDRREHEQQVYEAIQVCCGIVEAALDQTPTIPPEVLKLRCDNDVLREAIDRLLGEIKRLRATAQTPDTSGANGVAAYERGFKDGVFVGRNEKG